MTFGDPGCRPRALSARRARPWCSTPPPTPTSTAPRPNPDAGARRANAGGPEAVARRRGRGRRQAWSTTRPTSSSTASRSARTTRPIRRRRWGSMRAAKPKGTRAVAAATPRQFILRVGCVYGRGGRNFPSTIVRRLRAGEALRVDAERRVSPTWVREVASVSVALAATPHYGLYHCTAHGETTWADFARAVAGELGLPRRANRAGLRRRAGAGGAPPATRGAGQPHAADCAASTGCCRPGTRRCAPTSPKRQAPERAVD